MNSLAHDPFTLAYHELRSPLGLLATAARSMVEDSTEQAIRDRCAVIVRTVERMLRTTEQVFGVARTAGDETPTRFLPSVVLAGLIRDMDLAASVELHIEPDAGQSAVFGSRGAFEALAQSLLNNAVDHGEPGAPITVELTREDGELTLSVKNRVTAVRRHNGLGVGLYLCRRLADQLGGDLSAGLEGQSYRAYFAVPVATPSVDQHVAEPAHIA
jgi:signal transduction histidine kinase